MKARTQEVFRVNFPVLNSYLRMILLIYKIASKDRAAETARHGLTTNFCTVLRPHPPPQCAHSTKEREPEAFFFGSCSNLVVLSKSRLRIRFRRRRNKNKSHLLSDTIGLLKFKTMCNLKH